MTSQPSTPRPSAAGRYLFLFLLGLFVGAMCTVMLLRALQARTDPFPDALMQVMARQQGELKKAIDTNRCTVSDALPRLQSLRAMSNDLEGAFPSLRDDARFVASASALRGALDAALAQPPADCAALADVQGKVSESCLSCHRDFR
ncbi:hypothetical protein [Xanthomonas sp. XNM01]|uniref:hypothetical protein n=1 Tax=Xanthomonas sp. XNM01 TaxID=2769289 RepID=UPI0017850238|nr:hypothetical protein [Xanthomonas sp. XNM01]MBD9369157.1 hypothetical protein [Xanthomonas sp. XNM01]